MVAIRNLTEGNDENQRWIQSLKPKKARAVLVLCSFRSCLVELHGSIHLESRLIGGCWWRWRLMFVHHNNQSR